MSRSPSVLQKEKKRLPKLSTVAILQDPFKIGQTSMIHRPWPAEGILTRIVSFFAVVHLIAITAHHTGFGNVSQSNHGNNDEDDKPLAISHFTKSTVR